MSDKPVIGVIEWLSGSGVEPNVILGSTAEDVRARAAEFLASMLEDIEYIDQAWIDANPLPELEDAAAVKGWLDALQEQTTDAWLTIYAGAAEMTSNTYQDIRA